MATLMGGFTVVQPLEAEPGDRDGEHLAMALIDVLKVECPQALDDMIGFLILKSFDCVYMTFKSRASAQAALTALENIASLTQAMKRILDNVRPTRTTH